MLEARAPARVLLEVPTGREGVARCLEALGHHVVVADPNFVPMYATRTRKLKTDRRDARALAEACRVGASNGGAGPDMALGIGEQVRGGGSRRGLALQERMGLKAELLVLGAVYFVSIPVLSGPSNWG